MTSEAGSETVRRDLGALRDALFRPMGALGVFARTGPYEEVVAALGGLISRHRDARAEVLRFPPVMSRAALERSGYPKTFPHLLGCVCGLPAEPPSAPGHLPETDLVLTPASCYPVYPIAAAYGSVPEEGREFDVACDCFRREPSENLDRFQSFRMREFVRIGTRDAVRRFRGAWMERASALAEDLRLEHSVKPAHDPFFGRGAQFLARSQLDQGLKFELLVPILSAEAPTACMSFNLHETHFSEVWDLRTGEGAHAETSCVAFGIDRLALALFAAHGVRPSAWPQRARDTLGL